MRIIKVAFIAAAFTASAFAAEDATETVSAITAVGDAVAAVPLRDTQAQTARDTESLFSDVHGQVSVMVGTGGSYGVGGHVSGTYADKFHFSVSGSKSREPGLGYDAYDPYRPFGPRTRPLN